jgi:hypothetical protein
MTTAEDILQIVGNAEHELGYTEVCRRRTDAKVTPNVIATTILELLEAGDLAYDEYGKLYTPIRIASGGKRVFQTRGEHRKWADDFVGDVRAKVDVARASRRNSPCPIDLIMDKKG